MSKAQHTAAEEYRECPIHAWFDLSYSQFLTVPRLVMQSMPHEWKEKMAVLLTEIDATFDWRPKNGRYIVRIQDDDLGPLYEPPWEICDYRHGSVEHLKKAQATSEASDG